MDIILNIDLVSSIFDVKSFRSLYDTVESGIRALKSQRPVDYAYFDSVDGRTPPRWSSTSLSRSQTALAHLDKVFNGFQRARC